MRAFSLNDEAKDYESMGQRIRGARMQHGLTQEELAEATELSASYLSHIETAKKKASVSAMISLANALNVSLDWLVYGDSHNVQGVILHEAQALLEDCSVKEQRAILEVLKVVKNVLNEIRN